MFEYMGSRYKNVLNFFAVSTKTRKHINKLCRAVLTAARSSAFTRESYPRSFFQLESLVMSESANHIPPLVSIPEFDAMAESCYIDKKDAPNVLSLLSQLGMKAPIKNGLALTFLTLHRRGSALPRGWGDRDRCYGYFRSQLADTLDGHFDYF